MDIDWVLDLLHPEQSTNLERSIRKFVSMKAFSLIILACLATLTSRAQQSMDDKLFESLHGHGSFNVVFAILSIILFGLLFSLWRLDRKVSKLEKEFKK